MHGHVFHQAQDRDTHFFEHLDALFGVQQGDVLRRGHDHGARHGHALAQGELDVTGARRHVDDQIIQLFPVGLAQELLQRLGGHRAAPDHGLVLIDQKTDRHDLHAVVFHRLHGLAIFAFRSTFDAHHHGLAGAVDVGIEQTDLGTLGSQRQRQINGGGAFAHTAFARGHSHDVFHLRQQRHATLG